MHETGMFFIVMLCIYISISSEHLDYLELLFWIIQPVLFFVKLCKKIVLNKLLQDTYDDIICYTIKTEQYKSLPISLYCSKFLIRFYALLFICKGLCAVK